MKIAICSDQDNLEGDISEVFGRCNFFIFMETEDGDVQDFEVIENISKDQKGGAGISAAKAVAEKKPDAIISQNIGPRALDVLKQMDIKIYDASRNKKQAIKDLIDNKLQEVK